MQRGEGHADGEEGRTCGWREKGRGVDNGLDSRRGVGNGLDVDRVDVVVNVVSMEHSMYLLTTL